MDSGILRSIKADFKELSQDSEIEAILVFGSHVSGKSTSRSDIDICIVAPKSKDKVKTIRRVWRRIGGKYDAWLFEELPLYIQSEIIHNHEIIYCDDIPALFEYFYPYWDRIAEYLLRQLIAARDYC